MMSSHATLTFSSLAFCTRNRLPSSFDAVVVFENVYEAARNKSFRETHETQRIRELLKKGNF